MTLSDAISLIQWEATELPPNVDVRQVLEAGLVLVRHTMHQARELERERARWLACERSQGRRIEGHPLIEGADSGGPRHFLAGGAVHAGTGIYLLTHAGWLAGRYEWNWQPNQRPGFFLSLPGVLSEVSVPILAGARLAWPDEVEETGNRAR